MVVLNSDQIVALHKAVDSVDEQTAYLIKQIIKIC